MVGTAPVVTFINPRVLIVTQGVEKTDGDMWPGHEWLALLQVRQLQDLVQVPILHASATATNLFRAT